MMDKETRKNLKRIEKEIRKIKDKFRKIELRPCQNDLELKQKEEDLAILKGELYELEKEANRYLIHVSGARSVF